MPALFSFMKCCLAFQVIPAFYRNKACWPRIDTSHELANLRFDEADHSTTGPIHQMEVILLQHKNESNRPSGTAKLLFDKYDLNNQDSLLLPYLTVTRWCWSGRKDNDDIHKRIEKLQERNQSTETLGPTLIWTQSGSSSDLVSGGINRNSYIVLDGTWKEAQIMFRKMPFLHKLPRLSIEGFQTSYRLRSDYTKWRKKYSIKSRTRESGSTIKRSLASTSEESDLLCTAETVAAILDINDKEGGAIIRSKLQNFQEEYG